MAATKSIAESLPDEILLQTFCYLESARDKFAVSQVCSLWRRVAFDRGLWAWRGADTPVSSLLSYREALNILGHVGGDVPLRLGMIRGREEWKSNLRVESLFPSLIMPGGDANPDDTEAPLRKHIEALVLQDAGVGALQYLRQIGAREPSNLRYLSLRGRNTTLCSPPQRADNMWPSLPLLETLEFTAALTMQAAEEGFRKDMQRALSFSLPRLRRLIFAPRAESRVTRGRFVCPFPYDDMAGDLPMLEELCFGGDIHETYFEYAHATVEPSIERGLFGASKFPRLRILEHTTAAQEWVLFGSQHAPPPLLETAGITISEGMHVFKHSYPCMKHLRIDEHRRLERDGGNPRTALALIIDAAHFPRLETLQLTFGRGFDDEQAHVASARELFNAHTALHSVEIRRGTFGRAEAVVLESFPRQAGRCVGYHVGEGVDLVIDDTGRNESNDEAPRRAVYRFVRALVV